MCQFNVLDALDSATESAVRGRTAIIPPTAFRRSVGVRGQACFLGLLIVMLTTQSGCQIFQRFGSRPPAIPVTYRQLPSQQDLLHDLRNRSSGVDANNVRKIRQLDANVSVAMAGVPKIKGTLQVEFPDRMRMKAGLMGVAGVDVGSNEQRFWIWSKSSFAGQTPALYFADHEAFARSPMRQSVPIEPRWLIDAIGLVEFSPTDVHHGPVLAPDGRMKLYTTHQTPSGPQTRVTTFTASTGLIGQQAIYDSANRLIAYTNSSHYKHYADHQISLPQQIVLHMIQPDGQDVALTVDLGTYSINSLYGDANKMWSMPNPKDVQKVDLTQVSFGGANNQIPSQPVNSGAGQGFGRR